MHGINGFTAGVVTGAVVGVAASMIISPMDSGDIKRFQKNTGKFFTKIGNVVDNIMDIRG